MSKFLKYEHVSENVLCLLARACPNQDANTYRDRKGCTMNRQVVCSWCLEGSQRKCHPVMILG
eukprot:202992-Pelagomonas_calceolata.AAC.1